MTVRSYAVLCCGLALLFGCSSTSGDALQLNQLSLRDRQLQSRKYETTDEISILSACAALLQDLGFNLDESEPKLGILVGSKERSAVDASQEATAIAVAIIFKVDMATDKHQTMRCCIATSPHGKSHIAVRVTFQRMVWDENEVCTRRETIKEPIIYQDFFDKLSKAVFLEGQSL